MSRPDELGVRILKALGVDSSDVRALDLSVAVGEVPVLRVERWVFEAGEFETALEHYAVVRIEDEDAS